MSVCSNCGKENQIHYKYCLGCGAELSGEPTVPRAQPAPAPKAEPRVVPRTVLAEEMAPAAAPPAVPPPAAPEPAPAPTPVAAAPPVSPMSVDAPPPTLVSPPDDDSMLSAITSELSKGQEGTRPAWRPNGEAEAAAGGSEPEPVQSEPETEVPPETKLPALSSVPKITRPCTNCGHAVPVDFSFCGQCGSRLDADTAPRPKYSPSEVAGARGRLVLVRPDGSEGGSHPLEDGENTIGRGFGTLFDADGYLSPRHAELVLNAAGLVVRDAGSLNGVFARITQEEELLDGDIFRIGQELLRFDEIRAPELLEDGTEVLGSPNPGYWGRLAVIVGKELDGSAFPLFGDTIVMGRERGDLVFPEDGYVSGTHARVSFRDGRYFLCDLNSSNGTFIRIRGERLVPSGTFLLMGQQLFRVAF